jgi:hypothetical protein
MSDMRKRWASDTRRALGRMARERREKKKQEKKLACEREKQEKKLARANPLKRQFVTGQPQPAPLPVPSVEDGLDRSEKVNKTSREQEKQMPSDPENRSSTKAIEAFRARFMASKSTPASTSALPPSPPPVNDFTLNSTSSDQEKYARYVTRLRAKREGRVGEPDLTESQLKYLQMEHARLAKRKKAELARGGKPKPNRKMLTFTVDENVADKMHHVVYWYGAKSRQHFLEEMLLKAIDDLEKDLENEVRLRK